MDPLVAVLATAGAAFGFGADRLATRWPEHEPPFEPGRPVGWRTVLCVVVGGAGLAGVGLRFDDPLARAAFGAYALVLVTLLATDLDQRLMPSLLTWPALAIAAVYAASGHNPLVGGDLGPAVVGAIAIPLVPFVLSLPFGSGAFGLGDVWLLAGFGLAAGLQRAIVGASSGLLLSGVVIAVLLAARRISLRSYVPFGPFLIVGALWGILGPR